MAFRVFDSKEHKWVRGNQYIAKNGDLLDSKSKMFGNEKLSLMPETRYIWHQDIGYEDKNGRLIYEGDVCRIETEGGSTLCTVSYIQSCAAYMLVAKDYRNPEAPNNLVLYGFYEEVRDLIEVVGNVYDTPYDELVRRELEKCNS